jgi:hypothetical protein
VYNWEVRSTPVNGHRQVSLAGRFVPIPEVVASFDRFVLTREQKGFFGNLFRIVPADPSSR